MAAKELDSARARRHSPWPAYRSHRRSNIRAALQRLPADGQCVWQLAAYACYMDRWSTWRSNIGGALSAVDPVLTSLDVGARPFEATNTSSDLESARLRPSGGLATTQD